MRKQNFIFVEGNSLRLFRDHTHIRRQGDGSQRIHKIRRIGSNLGDQGSILGNIIFFQYTGSILGEIPHIQRIVMVSDKGSPGIA